MPPDKREFNYKPSNCFTKKIFTAPYTQYRLRIGQYEHQLRNSQEPCKINLRETSRCLAHRSSGQSH
jgi:hypothetical protein